MRDAQNITIGLLLVTAVILTGMLISTFTSTSSIAYGDTPLKQGDYILCTGAWSRDADLVYILNIATRQLNVYYSNVSKPRNKAIDLIDTVDLRRAFAD